MSAEKNEAKTLTVSSVIMEEAVSTVKQTGLSIRAVSKAFGISKSSLSRHVLKAKEDVPGAFSDNLNFGNRKMFSKTKEDLSRHVLKTKEDEPGAFSDNINIGNGKMSSKSQEDHVDESAEKSTAKKFTTYMDEAVSEVIEKGLSIRTVSEAFGISRSSLSRNVLKAKEAESEAFSDNPNNETFSRSKEDRLETSEEKNRAKRLRVSSANMEEAVTEVIEKGLSIRAVSEAFGISRSSLCRNVSKAKEVGLETFSHNPNIGNRKTFSSSQEDELEEYLKTVSKMCNGLTSHRIRQLAFEYAETLQLKYPVSWVKDKIAGIDWFKGFIRRHPQLSVRKTETTS